MHKITIADMYDERYADAAAFELERQREQWLEEKYQADLIRKEEE